MNRLHFCKYFSLHFFKCRPVTISLLMNQFIDHMTKEQIISEKQMWTTDGMIKTSQTSTNHWTTDELINDSETTIDLADKHDGN